MSLGQCSTIDMGLFSSYIPEPYPRHRLNNCWIANNRLMFPAATPVTSNGVFAFGYWTTRHRPHHPKLLTPRNPRNSVLPTKQRSDRWSWKVLEGR